MYNYELKVKEVPPSVYAGFFNQTPFYIGLTTNNPDYASLRVNFFSQNSNSAPYQQPQNKWSHLLPQWGFFDSNANYIEFANPYCVSETLIGGEIYYETCVSAYYVDNMPSNVTIIATLETSGLPLSSDNYEVDLPSYSNSLIYDEVEYSVLDIGANNIKITQDGKNPIDVFKWTDTKIPFIVTFHTDNTLPLVNNNIYGLTAVDPIIFKIPLEGSNSKLFLNLNNFVNSSVFWSEGSSVSLKNFDNYGFNIGGFFKGYFISYESISSVKVEAHYSELLYQTNFSNSDFLYVNDTGDSWLLSSNTYYYKNKPQTPIVLTSIFIGSFDEFILDFDYNFINFETMGKNAKFLIDLSDQYGNTIKNFDVLSVTSGNYFYNKTLSSDAVGGFISLQLSSTYDGDFPTPSDQFARLGRIYNSDDFGVSLNINFSPIRLWTDVKISSDGKFQLAASRDGVYLSDDYGKSFEKINLLPSGTWESVSISETGQYMLASLYNSTVYKSNDFGVTWTSVLNTSGRERLVIISKNGQHQIIFRGWFGTNTLKSNDFGNTWTTITNPYETSFISGAISNNGQIISVVFNYWTGFAVDFPYGKVFVSQDGGLNWSSKEMPNSEWVASVCMTSDGSVQFVGTSTNVESLNPPIKIYKSVDGGQSWFDPNIDTSNWLQFSDTSWYKGITVNCSDLGTNLIASVFKGKVYYSSDSGSTFSEISNSFFSWWKKCSISSDGKYIALLSTRIDETYDFSDKELDLRFNGFNLNNFNVFKENLIGESNEFQIKKFERPYELRRFNESWDTAATMKSFALAEHTFNNPVFFDNFLEVSVGGLNPNFQSLGRRFYERISNFVKNNSDIDVCNLNQLYSLHQEIDTPIDDYRLSYPSEIRRLVDIMSIKKENLLGGFCKCNRNFTRVSNPCYFCGHFHPLNRTETPINPSNYTVSANIPFVIENIYTKKENYQFDLIYPSTQDMNGLETGIMSSFASISWLTSANYLKYNIYDFIPDYCNEQMEGVINWNDSYTTLLSSVSTYNDLYRDNGILEEVFNFEIHRGLYNV